MSWITIVWSMLAAVFLTLALFQLFVGFRQPNQGAHVSLSLTAAGVAAMALAELMAMRAATVEQMATVLRWFQLPALVTTVAIICFVRLYLRAGRLWLAWAAGGLRALALVLGFTTGENLFFSEVTGLRQVALPGAESITLPQGPLNPWYVLGPLAVLILVAYVVDACVHLWRRGADADRRRAVTLGGSIAFFLLAAVSHAALVNAGVADAPYVIALSFIPTVVAMGYELSGDVFRAAKLASRLQVIEAALRESEERVELAANAAELGLWVWDIGKDDVWITDKGRSLFGFSGSERIDLNRFLVALHPEDRKTVHQDVTLALAGRGDYESEYRVMLPGGQMRWIAARGRVESGEDGRPLRLRGVVLDVTRGKQIEQQVQEQRNELAHLSRVTMLGELSGSLAHELNQPLTAILSNAQAAQRFLAGDDADVAELRDILADIVEDDKRAGEVIRRLRALFRKDEFPHEMLDLNELVQDVLRLVRSDLVNRGVTVVTELAPGLLRVRGDRVQLQQVLLNLVVNGCDAMADATAGHRQLALGTIAADREGVEVVVSDCGSGIPPGTMERIFEPFFTTKPQGMGLGLAMCRTIVEAHGGRLWATNNSGGGASFHVVLPANPGGSG